MPTASAETVALSGEETTIRRPSSQVIPFASGARSPAIASPAQSVKPISTRTPQEANPLEGTLALDDDSFIESSPNPASGKQRPGFDGATLAIGDAEDRAAHEVAAPFRIAASGSAKGAPAAPIPGAPWAGPAPASKPKPSFKDTTLTLADEAPIPRKADVNTIEPAPPSKEAPRKEAPPPEPEKQAASEKKPSWSWAPQPEAPAPAPAATKKAPPPPPPPKPAVKSKLYGSFGEPKKK
jgi:hypothetical protein